MKVLGAEQRKRLEERERQRVHDKFIQNHDWFYAYRYLTPEYRERNMVDSSMTYEQIKEHARRQAEEHVPYVWRHNICMCYHPKYDNQALVCRECGKIARWRLQPCDNCRELHITGDFKHHKHGDGPYVRWCFDCLAGEFGEREEDSPPEHVTRAVPEANFTDLSFSLDF